MSVDCSCLYCPALSRFRKAFALTAVFCLTVPQIAFAKVTPNDTFFGKEWHLRQIQIEDAWEVTTGSSDIIVAMIDGGVDIKHPDLAPNIWVNDKEIPGDGLDNDGDGYRDDIHGWNYITHTGDVSAVRSEDQSVEAWSHGTMTASLLGAIGNNARGIAGVAWNVRLMPLVVLDQDGNGGTEDIVLAMRYAVSHGAKIINLSLVGYDYDDQLATMIERAHDAGVLIVAATGNNDGSEEGIDLDFMPGYPACMDVGKRNLILGVSGTDTLDQKAPYANYGHDCTDISAPGQAMFAARPSYSHDPHSTSTAPGYIDDITGTSLSAPLVSGVAALIWSVEPTWTVDQVRDRLLATADSIDSVLPAKQRGKLGVGRLNAKRALEGLPPAVKTPSIPLQEPTVSLHGNLATLTRWDVALRATTTVEIALRGNGPWTVTTMRSSGHTSFILTSSRSPFITFLDGVSGVSVTKAPYGERVLGMQAVRLEEDGLWLIFPTFGGGHAMLFRPDGSLTFSGFPFGKTRVGTWNLQQGTDGMITVSGPGRFRVRKEATLQAWKAL